MLPPSTSTRPAALVEQRVADFFRPHQWTVEVPADGPDSADLLVQRGAYRFVVEVKAPSESRPDRVLPMLAMAILQVQAAAERFHGALPLAIVYVPAASASLVKQVDTFGRRFAKDVAVGLISGSGEQYFCEAALQALNRSPARPRRAAVGLPSPTVNLFSDLNQWMLKLLLAWELPEGLLNAPRQRYHNGSELAEAAQVSAMSTSRFLQQLRSDGHLSDASQHLMLVRREDLQRPHRQSAQLVIRRRRIVGARWQQQGCPQHRRPRGTSVRWAGAPAG